MILDILELMQINLTPDNTLYFENETEQNNFFTNFADKVLFENVSYNGGRNIRINFNSIFLNQIGEANYGRFKTSSVDFGTIYTYFFIDGFVWVNDNVCEISITIDYTQTFMFRILDEIKVAKIGHITPKDSYFDEYVPYTNKLTPSDFIQEKITEIGLDVTNRTGEYLLFICVNFGELPEPLVTDTFQTITEYGYNRGVYCGLFPIVYKNGLFYNCECHFKSEDPIAPLNYTAKTTEFSNVIKYLAPYIIDSSVGLITTPFDSSMFVTRTSSDRYLYDVVVDKSLYQIFELHYAENPQLVARFLSPVSVSSNLQYSFDIKHLINELPKALQRNPYCYLRIGNDTESIEVNLLDFISGRQPKNNNFVIKYKPSLVYPFGTTLEFSLYGNNITDKHMYFNLITNENVPFSISKWEEYYANNKFSVNDGLATQQHYQTAQLRNNLKANQEKTNVSAVMGAVNWGVGVFENQVTAGADLLSLDVSSAAKATSQNLISALRTGAKIGESYWMLDIENARQYENLQLEQQKERELLSLNWNDIKSSPSTYSNTSTTLVNKYAKSWQGISVDLYYPKNLIDIMLYHKLYGYKVDRYMVFDKTKYLKQHTIYDYISVESIQFNSTLPHIIQQAISSVLSNGVRFWYDYNTFLNFEIENTERA